MDAQTNGQMRGPYSQETYNPGEKTLSNITFPHNPAARFLYQQHPVKQTSQKVKATLNHAALSAFWASDHCTDWFLLALPSLAPFPLDL